MEWTGARWSTEGGPTRVGGEWRPARAGEGPPLPLHQRAVDGTASSRPGRRVADCAVGSGEWAEPPQYLPAMCWVGLKRRTARTECPYR